MHTCAPQHLNIGAQTVAYLEEKPCLANTGFAMHDYRARTTARGPLQSPHEKLLLDSPTCETMIWPQGSCPHELSIHRSGPISPIHDPKQSAGRTRGTQTG